MKYKEFPPYEYFVTCLKLCPECAHLYVALWRYRDDNYIFKIDKAAIREEFLMSPTIFKNKLNELVDLNLLTYRENETSFEIYLVYEPQ